MRRKRMPWEWKSCGLWLTSRVEEECCWGGGRERERFIHDLNPKLLLLLLFLLIIFSPVSFLVAMMPMQMNLRTNPADPPPPLRWSPLSRILRGLDRSWERPANFLESQRCKTPRTCAHSTLVQRWDREAHHAPRTEALSLVFRLSLVSFSLSRRSLSRLFLSSLSFLSISRDWLSVRLVSQNQIRSDWSNESGRRQQTRFLSPWQPAGILRITCKL